MPKRFELSAKQETSQMIKRTALLLGTLFVLSAPVFAADGHSHAGKHGGKVVESGHHHLEVVARDGAIEIYVEGEDGKPEDVSAATARATVLSEGKKEDITLASDAANVLKGTGAFKAGKGTVIVVTLTMPDHEPEQVRVELD
jgi:hypothetical protein